MDIRGNAGTEKCLEEFLSGKPEHTLHLFWHFLARFQEIGDVSFYPTKTMIGIATPEKRIAWITQLGKNFIHVVFPFERPFVDNLCFQKIAQVPGTSQYNHHLRILYEEDINDEIIHFMKIAYQTAE